MRESQATLEEPVKENQKTIYIYIFTSNGKKKKEKKDCRRALKNRRNRPTFATKHLPSNSVVLKFQIISFYFIFSFLLTKIKKK